MLFCVFSSELKIFGRGARCIKNYAYTKTQGTILKTDLLAQLVTFTTSNYFIYHFGWVVSVGGFVFKFFVRWLQLLKVYRRTSSTILLLNIVVHTKSVLVGSPLQETKGFIKNSHVYSFKF